MQMESLLRNRGPLRKASQWSQVKWAISLVTADDHFTFPGPGDQLDFKIAGPQ